MQIVATLRIDALPANGDVAIVARGGGRDAELAVGEGFASLPRGEWIRVGVMLKCLRTAGADTAKLEVPFAIRGSAGLDVSIADITAATHVDHRLACPT